MKKFFALKNRDAADAYVKALLSAGYTNAGHMEEADFLLYDYERGSGGKRAVIERFLQTRPGFIYPHTPASSFIWDGPYSPLPVSCNFVAGEGQRKSMEAYGYPSRVEAVGFPRCEVVPFKPSAGRSVLFVPARTRKDGGYANVDYKTETPLVFRFLLDHRHEFDGIEMCYTSTLENVGIKQWEDEAVQKGVVFHLTNPYKDEAPFAAMLERIEHADLVISCETVGYVAVARGKPAIFYNAFTTPETLAGRAENYEKYRKYFQFPLSLEYMDIQEVFAVMENQNLAVELWKQDNIGGNFMADKFLSIVKEYL